MASLVKSHNTWVSQAAKVVNKCREGAGSILDKDRSELYSRIFGQWHRDHWDEEFAGVIFECVEGGRQFRYEEIVGAALTLQEAGEAVSGLNIFNALSQELVTVYTGGEPMVDDVSVTERACESSASVLVNVKTGKVHRHKGKAMDASSTACNKVMAKANVQMFGGEKPLDFDPDWCPCHTCFPTGPEQDLENGCDKLCGALRVHGKQCHGYCSLNAKEHSLIGMSAHFCAFHFEPKGPSESSSSKA